MVSESILKKDCNVRLTEINHNYRLIFKMLAYVSLILNHLCEMRIKLKMIKI